MDITVAIILLSCIGLTGYLLYERSKKRSAEALNANNKTKEEVAEIQKGVDSDNVAIEAEKQKQADIQKAADEEKAKNVTQDDLLNFYNKPTDK